MNNIFGIAASLIYITLVIGTATLLQKKGKLGVEGSRKFIHILLSNWWLLAVVFFDSPLWAAAVPALFVAVNFLSYRFNVIKSMERGEGASDLGTVWYAVALLVMTLWTFTMREMLPFGTIAILAMGYGDGFAAVIGKKFGRTRYPAFGTKKTLEGSAAVFGAVFALAFTVLTLYGFEHAAAYGLILAAAGTLIELFTPLGLDNLTLPLGLAALLFWMYSGSFPAEILTGVSLSLLIILPAFAKNTLTLAASLGAITVGTLIYFGGGGVFFLMLAAFYVSSVLIGTFGKRVKKPVADAVHQRHGKRTLVQVLANGGVAAIFAVLYKFTAEEPFAAAYMASIAAATADTWASELGMLSGKIPRSILTGREVQKGLSGGVTALGFAGAAAGALIITAVGVFYVPVTLSKGLLLFVIFAGGLLGSAADSILGDTMQAKFLHPVHGHLTEKPVVEGMKTTLKRGLRFINNDMVNLLSGVFAGIVMMVAAILA